MNYVLSSGTNPCPSPNRRPKIPARVEKDLARLTYDDEEYLEFLLISANSDEWLNRAELEDPNNCEVAQHNFNTSKQLATTTCLIRSQLTAD